MCVYCESKYGRYPHDLVGETWEAHIAYKARGGKMRPTLYVLTEGRENHFANIPIHYCPICGRKLEIEVSASE